MLLYLLHPLPKFWNVFKSRGDICITYIAKVPLRFCFRLCGNQKPEEKIVSTNEEMLLAFRSNWDYEFYHARKGFKAVIRAGNYFSFTYF